MKMSNPKAHRSIEIKELPKRFELTVGLTENAYGVFYVNKKDFYDITRLYTEQSPSGHKDSQEYYNAVKAMKSEEVAVDILSFLGTEAEWRLNNAHQRFDKRIADWALESLSVYKQLKEAVEATNFKEEQLVLLNDGRELEFSLCSYKKIESFHDIEFILSNSEEIGINSSNNLIEFAQNAASAKEVLLEQEESKKALVNFYKEYNIGKILTIPEKHRSNLEDFLLDSFSDHYKDVFGKRPRGIENEVERILQEESKEKLNEEEKVEEDLEI